MAKAAAVNAPPVPTDEPGIEQPDPQGGASSPATNPDPPIDPQAPNNDPQPEPAPEPAIETGPEVIDLVLDRDIALGQGTRKRNSLIGQIVAVPGAPISMAKEDIEFAEGWTETEIENLLMNPQLIRAEISAR